jgi:hypothetical protein
MTFLSRGRSSIPPTVVTAAPPGSSPQSKPAPGAVQEFSAGLSEVMQGRVSLVMLQAFTILLIGFYLWTRRAQGGG